MKKIVFAMATAWVLAVGVGPGLATERNADAVSDGCRRNFDNQCDRILASKHGQAPAYIRYCENRQ